MPGGRVAPGEPGGRAAPGEPGSRFGDSGAHGYVNAGTDSGAYGIVSPDGEPRSRAARRATSQVGTETGAQRFVRRRSAEEAGAGNRSGSGEPGAGIRPRPDEPGAGNRSRPGDPGTESRHRPETTEPDTGTHGLTRSGQRMPEVEPDTGTHGIPRSGHRAPVEPDTGTQGFVRPGRRGGPETGSDTGSHGFVRTGADGRGRRSAQPEDGGGEPAAGGEPGAGGVPGPRRIGPGDGRPVRAAAAVVPPVVPGPEGARTPAVPGRAGAMADSTSGVVRRPGVAGGARGAAGVPPQGGKAQGTRPGGRAETPGEAGGDTWADGDDFEQPGRRKQRPGPARGGAAVPGAVAGAAAVPGAAVPGRAPAGPAAPSGSTAPGGPAGGTARGGAVVPGQPAARPDGTGPVRAGAAVPVPRVDVPEQNPNGTGPIRAGAAVPVPGVEVPGRNPDGTGPVRAGAAVPVPGVEVPGRNPDGTGPIRAGAAVPSQMSPAPMSPAPEGPARFGADQPDQGRMGTAGTSPDRSVLDGAGDGASPVPGKEVSGLRGAGAELRHKIRTQRRLRVGVLSSLAAFVLFVMPAFVGVRAMTSDPVFASLDALNVPSWATQKAEDQGSGSPWCFLDCRFWERMAESERPFQETAEAYTSALTAAGWTQWKVAECPETPINTDEGSYSCWRRDELTLDLYVSLPGCAVEQITSLPEGEEGAAADAAPGECEGSTVSIKVQNTIMDLRGRTETNPGPLGETPDPVLPTDDPLLEPTPEAS